MASLALAQTSLCSFSGLASLRTSQRSSRRVARLSKRQVCRAAADGEKAPEAPEPVAPATPPRNTPDYYTGYIKTDAAGVVVIDVVEPAVYVAKPGSSAEDQTSMNQALFGTMLALGGATTALILLNSSTPVDQALTLSEYVQKFSAEASAPALSAAAAVEEVIVLEATAAPALEIEAVVVEPEVEPVTVVEAAAEVEAAAVEESAPAQEVAVEAVAEVSEPVSEAAAPAEEAPAAEEVASAE